MSNPFVSFAIKATILLASAFCIHLAVLIALKLPAFENRIVLSYFVNLILVLLIFGLLYIFKEKYKSQLGFLFLGGSFLKFAIFFILFYPFYKRDNNISQLEFLAFFIPYTLGLIIETISLSKWLNKLE